MAPAKRSRTPLLVGAVVLVVLVIGIAIGSLASKDDGSSSTQASGYDDSSLTDGSATGDSGSSADGPDDGDASFDGSEEVPDTTAPPTTTAVPTTTPDPEAAALLALTEQVESGRARVDEGIVDSWVPQISSKQIGIHDKESGITYSTYQSILDDFRNSEQRFGDVLLLDSGGFSTFSQGGLYVTVSAASFSTPEGANGWCDQQNLSPNNCFAKFLSHTVPASSDAQEYRS